MAKVIHVRDNGQLEDWTCAKSDRKPDRELNVDSTESMRWLD